MPQTCSRCRIKSDVFGFVFASIYRIVITGARRPPAAIYLTGSSTLGGICSRRSHQMCFLKISLF